MNLDGATPENNDFICMCIYIYILFVAGLQNIHSDNMEHTNTHVIDIERQEEYVSRIGQDVVNG